MPRNPDKIPCAVPGCRSWAMRGYARCYAHRDPEVGPDLGPDLDPGGASSRGQKGASSREQRGAGAPPGNLNALRHGAYAHPLPAPGVERLVAAAVEHPDELPLQVGLAVRSIQARVRDPYLVAVALRALASLLVDRLAAHLFSAELAALLAALPAPARGVVQAVIEQHAARHRPEDRLLALRKMKTRRKQSPEPGSAEQSSAKPSLLGRNRDQRDNE